MYKHRRMLVSILAIIMALLMLFSLVAMTIPAFAVTQAEYDNLKKKNNQLASDKKKLDSELSALRTDKNRALKEKENLDMQIAVLDDQIETAELLIDSLEGQIEQKTIEIENAKQDEADEYELFKKRVVAMEKRSHMSTWAVLLGATSFSDFLARAEVMRDVVNYDLELMQSLKETRETIERVKAELVDDKVFHQTLLDELEKNRAESEEKLKQQDNYLETLRTQEKLTAEELSAIAKEIEAADKELDRMFKELAKRKTYVGGEYMWPLPSGHTNITSPYGYRTHPTTGKKNSLHSGTDIGAKKGTEIYAANSGTVIVATYSNSWGNYVMIDHGGGNVTLYAHMSKMATSVNKEVKQGQVIGYVGSTGWSTGPHLHFELRINGVATNVMKYFKKIQ